MFPLKPTVRKLNKTFTVGVNVGGISGVMFMPQSDMDFKCDVHIEVNFSRYGVLTVFGISLMLSVTHFD